jgi:hypothetical protein
MLSEQTESLVALAEDLRRRLDRMLGLAATGRPSDLTLAGNELQTAVGGFAQLHQGIRAAQQNSERPQGGAGVEPDGASPPHRLAAELRACQRLVQRLAPLIEQGQAIRLAHWTPPPVGSYTPGGEQRAPLRGPQLVRQVG